MDIDHLSLSTTPITLLNGDLEISQGTGFYFIRIIDGKNVVFLVTNYHVLTGSSPNEKKEPLGDNIFFHLHQSKTESSMIKILRIPIYNDDSKPIWVQSEIYPDADLAVIPIPAIFLRDCVVNCISEDWAKTNLRVRPTSSITVIGYPYGFYDQANYLPVWKTGNVASEPNVDFSGKPYFLIDISAFPGMSGSPVFAVSYGSYETEDGNLSVGGARKFLGIYASMQMLTSNKYLEYLPQSSKIGFTLSESLQLGHVWKSKLIIDTINSITPEIYNKEILENYGKRMHPKRAVQ